MDPAEARRMRALDDLVGEIFKGSPAHMLFRKVLLVFGSLAVWLLMALVAHPPALISTLIRTIGEIFSDIVQIPFVPGMLNATLYDGAKLVIVIGFLVWEVIQGLFAPDVFRHVIALGVPIYLAYRIAVIYLDDIFELSDQRTAFRYLRASAFGIKPYKLVIEKGDVSSKDKKNPIVLIGGPGEVQVNLENVAVFDQLDGEAHVIGPTLDKPDHTELLGSFERLRAIIDLRDQMTRNNELSVEGRSRDGIPVVIRDVRMVYSVQRDSTYTGGNPNKMVYSYRNDAIFNLVYNRPPGSWTATMTRLIRRRLQSFIATHSLSEILAAVGMPEMEEQRTSATRIGQQAEAFFPGTNSDFLTNSQPVDIPTTPPPNFVPRLRLTDLFYENRPQGFQNQARQRGVQLHWIDVGTLWIPPGPIPDFQMDAWRMTIENTNRQKELENLENESRLEELTRLIRDIPLITYTQASEAGKSDEEIMADLVSDYHGLLRSAQDVYTQDEKPVPPKLETAIRLTSRYLQNYIKKTGQARYL
jgi:hypothetical protein